MNKYLNFEVENIELLEDENNSEFLTASIDAFSSGLSRNNTFCDEESLKESSEEALNNFIVTSRLQQEKIKNRGYRAILEDKKDLYISNWILQENETFSSYFLKQHNLLEYDDVVKLVKKAFITPSYDLNKDEMELYKALEYIEPVYSGEDLVVGYTLSDSFTKASVTDTKLVYGKFWNLDGECKNRANKTSVDYFVDNVYKWIKFPHLLDKAIKQSFESIGGKS